MADVKDRRIVEMQFENKQFEKNIAKSTKSVEDLKKAMNFDQVSNGLKKFSDGLKNIDLSGLTNNIQKLADKFTGLGTISELVISQVRRKIEEAARAVSGFIDSMTTQQISAGMDKYEMLNKSVQTIKAATGRDEADVYKVLERLNQYTDQTSYNFSDMAQNIGKFTSVGINLEDAEKQMEGIANWAARSGAGINEASRAMYNLSQAMGVGKMTLIDWKSIENAGMATKEFKEQLIQAGLAAGTLVNDKGVVKTAKSLGKQVAVTYQNVGSTFNKGWATSKVISSTLEKYYYDDLYYEGEQKAILELNDTQKKSFESMMESGEKLDATEWKHLESTGAITEETKQKILDLAVSQGKLTKETDKDGKTIYKTVSKTGKQIEFTVDKIGESLKAGWFDKGFGESITSINDLAKSSYEAAQKCLTFTDVLNAWKDQISTGWMTSFKLIFGELSESMEFFSNVCDRVGSAIGELIDLRNGALKAWSNLGGRDSLIGLILGDYGNETETGAYGFLDLLGGVKNLIQQGLIDFLGLFGDEFDRMQLKKNPLYLKAFLGKQIKNITDGIGNFLKKIRDFFNAEVEYDGKTKTRLEVIGDVVKGIGGALKLGLDLLGGVTEFIGMIGSDLTPGLDSLLEFFGDLGLSFFNTSKDVSKGEKIKKFFEELREIVHPLTESLNSLMISLSNLLYTIFGLGDEGATQTEGLKRIGEVIKTIANIVTKVASPIITFISRIIDLISNLVKEGINADSLKKFGAGLGEGFGEMMNSFADALPKKLSFLSDWIHGIFGGATDEAEKQSNSLFGLISGVRDKASKTEKDAKKGEGKNGGAGILGLLTGSNIAVWLGVASLVSVIMLINKAKKTVGVIGKFFGSLGDSLKNGFKVKFNDESFATKFIKICTGIALVAASILVLGSMPLNSLIQGGIAVVVVVGIMYGLYKLLERSAAKGDFKNQMAFSAQVASMAFAMAALAIAVGILTLALIPFTLMNWDQYARAMAGLGGILLEMIGFMALIKLLKLDKSSIIGFAGFAIGLGILVQGLLPFANMSWDQYAKVMAGLGGVLLEIIAFMELFKILGLSTLALNFKGITKFAIALAILIFAIKPFANMSWDQYAKVMAGLGGVLLEILAFMELFKLLGLSTLALNFKGIMKFTIALAILILAIQPFAHMSWEQYAKVMAGLGGVLIEILAFMELFKLLGLSTLALNFKGIMKFVIAIAILILAIQPFANMSWEQYARVMAGLGGVLLEILAFMELFKVLGLSTKALDFSGILLFAIGLTILINAIMPFKDMDWEQYAKTMAGLGGVLILIAGFMWLLKKIDSPTLQIAAFMGFAYGIGALINAIMPFANMEWHQFAMVMIGLVATLGIMMGFMALVKRMNPNTGKMLKLAVFAGIFAAVAALFAVVLTIVKDVDWKVIAAFTVGLTLLLVGIGAAAAIANVIGVRGFLILAIGVALIFGALALVLPLLIGSVMGALRDAAGDLTIITDLMGTISEKADGMNESSLEKAKRMISMIGEIVGLIASFIFNAGSTRDFMICMSQLVLAADQMIKFDQRLKTMSPDGGIGKAMLIIAGFRTIFLEQLADFGSFYGYADAFYSAIYKLGSAFDYFDTMTKDMKSADENNGLQLIKQLAACAPDLDTIYKMDLDLFKKQLAELGGAMIIYAQGAEKVNGGEISDGTDVSGAVTLLHKIAEAFKEDDGFVIPSNMPEEDAITEFGVEIAALAGALVAFEEAGKGLGKGTQNAINALDYFTALKTKLLSMTGFGSDLQTSIDSFKVNGEFVAKDELTQFGEDIAQLGSAMKNFAASTQYIDETGEVKPIDFTKATEALDSIASLNDHLPRIGGALSAVMGRKQTLNDLSIQINLLGSALGEFYTDTRTVNNGIEKEMEFSNVQSFLESIVKVQTELATIHIGGLPDFFFGHEENFGDLSSQLVQLGSGLSVFANKIMGKNEKGEQTGEPFNSTVASEATRMLNNDMVPFMRTLANQLPNIGGLGQIISTAFKGRDFQLKDLGDQIGALGPGLGALGKGLNDGGWTQDLGINNAMTALDNITGIMVKLSQINELSGVSARTAFVHLIEFVDALANGVTLDDQQAAMLGVDQKQPPIAAALADFMDAISIEIGKFAKTEEELKQVQSRLEVFKLFMESLGRLTSIDMTGNWKALGTKFTTDLAASIVDGSSSVTNAVQNMIKNARSSADTVEGVSWYSLGENIGLGIKNGVDYAEAQWVTPAVKQMMVTAYEAGKKAIDSNSPSKLFAELGEFMGEGTAIGIENSTNAVGKNAGLMGEIALDKARDIIALISTAMAEDISAQPTITPMLDLTNIQAGMSEFKNSLNGYSINLDSAALASRAAYAGPAKYSENVYTKPDYSGIYERMNQLGNQINDMNEAISKMKLVLDTGALVGGISDKIDQDFGRKSFYASRNN